MTEPKTWRCFHCDEVFDAEASACLHFGVYEDSKPACQIKAGAEGSLLKALRTAEADAHRAIHAMHEESTEGWKAYHTLAGRLREQVNAANDAGFEQGLREGRSQFDFLLTFVQDLAGHGTRHDTNPTRLMPLGQPPDQIDQWWNSYFKSADQSIRDRAKAMLKEIDR